MDRRRCVWYLTTLALTLQVSAIDPENHFFTTYVNGSTTVVSGVYSSGNHDWSAQVAFTNNSAKYGWNIMDVETNANKSDDEQMYQAGYLEGYLTSKLIENHWTNTQKDICANATDACDKVNQYLDQNLDYINDTTSKNMNDPYWYQVYLYYKHFDGLCDGYNASNPSLKLTKRQLLWQNLAMDVSELKHAYSTDKERENTKRDGHCSALIKLTENNKQIVFGHVAWITYNWMTRLLKRYHLPVHVVQNSADVIPGEKMSFSSYPGITYSMDDYYLITSSKLVAIETTNNVYNKSIYNMDPKSQVLEGVRNTVANRLAKNGSEWAKYYSQQNSGTYNNQFMVLDFNKFTPGKTPASGTLWLVEQMPGKVKDADITETLVNNTAFSSYNIPFFPEIYEYSGYADQYNKYGDWFSHENCTRAKLFKRLHSKVNNTDSLIQILRYNHYMTDAESICANNSCNPPHNPSESISARGDLYPMNGTVKYPYQGYKMFGGIDVKVSSDTMFAKEEMISIAGPSPSDDLPVFSWSGVKTNCPHVGQPDKFDFDKLTSRWGSFDYGTPTSAASTSTLALCSFLPLILAIFFNRK